MKQDVKQISTLLRAISPSPRLRILLAIGSGEACVCHLEAFLGWRQAYISQHLMGLRSAKVLTSRREGRFIYYRLRKPEILTLIEQAADLLGVGIFSAPLAEQCACPACSPEDGFVPIRSI